MLHDARNYKPGTNAATATILTFFLLAAFDIITTGICVVCPTSSALTSYNITGIIIFRAITLFREAGWRVLRSSGIFSALVQQGELRYHFVTRCILTTFRRLNIFLVSRTNTLNPPYNVPTTVGSTVTVIQLVVILLYYVSVFLDSRRACL